MTGTRVYFTAAALLLPASSLLAGYLPFSEGFEPSTFTAGQNATSVSRETPGTADGWYVDNMSKAGRYTISGDQAASGSQSLKIVNSGTDGSTSWFSKIFPTDGSTATLNKLTFSTKTGVLNTSGENQNCLWFYVIFNNSTQKAFQIYAPLNGGAFQFTPATYNTATQQYDSNPTKAAISNWNVADWNTIDLTWSFGATPTYTATINGVVVGTWNWQPGAMSIVGVSFIADSRMNGAQTRWSVWDKPTYIDDLQVATTATPVPEDKAAATIGIGGLAGLSLLRRTPRLAR